jgi:fermentation-respiration switch protein FrsA (DUF1100 family)
MPRRWMTLALNIVVLLVIADAAVLALLWRFQERIVFQPPASPGSTDTATSTMTYTSRDGVRLVAFVVEPERAEGPIILAFHGNAIISRWMIPWAREVSRRFGATVVLPEYRGYDGLAGTPTYAAASLDAAAALAAVRERFHVSATDMIFYGHSLGTAIATELASNDPPRALVLESPFTSARDMAGLMPVVGVRLIWTAISRVHYQTSVRVATLDVPVSVVHGERDVVVPARMGRAVHAAARRKGSLLVIPEAGHNDVAIAGGDAYWRWLGEAIRSGPH